MKSVEDFTELEQRAACFGGDPVSATRMGMKGQLDDEKTTWSRSCGSCRPVG